MQASTTASSAGVISQKVLLRAVVQSAFEQKFSIAAWQLPGAAKIELILSKNSRYVSREDLLEELPPGFIFAPYNRTEKSIFLDADYIFTFVDGVLAKPVNPHEERSHAWLTDLQAGNMVGNSSNHYQRHDPLPSISSKEQFCKLIENAMTEIASGEVEKIVTSRARKIGITKDFDVVSSFEKLCTAFPNAMVTLVSAPECGTWIGASPELLVSVKDSIFKTIALAGTQVYHEGTNLKSVAWTQKEIEEQALVERYIISCFKKIRLREYDEHGPKTVIAGNLIHLRSDFTVNIRETNFPQLGTVMLQLLHPTSAVCGMPLEKASVFLQANEGYDRMFYSGYLGPVNVNQEIHVFVNLRCMKVADGYALLFAGAGVTADSVAEKEWEETEMKMNTLLHVLTA